MPATAPALPPHSIPTLARRTRSAALKRRLSPSAALLRLAPPRTSLLQRPSKPLAWPPRALNQRNAQGQGIPSTPRNSCAEPPMAEEASRVLVTFDVDGTLVRGVGVGHKLHKEAFSYAFKEVFGIDGTIDAIQHHGSTDKLVAMTTLEFYGIPKSISEPRIDEITAKMLESATSCAERGEAAEGMELLPGVRQLLTSLKSLEPRVVTGMVTGNLEQIAWLKMAGLGIDGLFSEPKLGGFGSDHVDRGELVKIAAQRAAERIPGPPFRLHVHVGDTPNDILAAQFGGARPLGVCTGIFSRDELSSVVTSDDAVILDSLADLGSALKACGVHAEGLQQVAS